MENEKRLPARDAADHLLLGAADRESGIAWVEQKTGVKAVIGGSHPGIGTCNALLSLGGRQYLEIIAPDPAQSQLVERYAFLKTLTTPRLFSWAAAMSDGPAAAERFRAAGFEIFGPSPGSRNRPDGKQMKWKSLGVKSDLGNLIPFFIEWDAGLTHPAADSPPGCRLRSIEFTHPRPEAVRETLRRLGIEAKINRGADDRLKAVLDSPRGKVVLS
ncbi:MAG: VOC family protein [Blastocatellia bacterium]